MGVMQLAWQNYSDAGALSGGDWEAALPLSNLQNRLQSAAARSVDLLSASTQFDVDLGASPPPVRLVALIRHNCAPSATWRLTAGTTPGGSDIYDSGTLNVWPAVYLPEDLEWEDNNWWLGTISAAEAANYPISLIFDTGQNRNAQYWRFSFSDATNAAGYLQFGRLWMGPVWSPTRTYKLGASLVWEPRSTEERSLGGVLFFDEQPPARVFSFDLGSLTNIEAWGQMLELQREARNDGEVLLIADPDDAQRGFKRNFLGRLRRADPLAQVAFGYQSTGFEIEELL
jgi:hypothetical protein